MNVVYWCILGIVATIIVAFIFELIMVNVYFKRRDRVIHDIFTHCTDSVYADREPLIEFDDMYPIPKGTIWLSDCRLDHIVPKEKIKYLRMVVNKSDIE